MLFSFSGAHNWINQRLKSIEIRKELTDEWKQHDLQEGVQFPFKYLLADSCEQACRQLWAGLPTIVDRQSFRQEMPATHQVFTIIRQEKRD